MTWVILVLWCWWSLLKGCHSRIPQSFKLKPVEKEMCIVGIPQRWPELFWDYSTVNFMILWISSQHFRWGETNVWNPRIFIIALFFPPELRLEIWLWIRYWVSAAWSGKTLKRCLLFREFLLNVVFWCLGEANGLRPVLRIRLFLWGESWGVGDGRNEKGITDEVAIGCAIWSYIQKGLGTEVSFALFPEGGDVGAWMGSVAVRRGQAFPGWVQSPSKESWSYHPTLLAEWWDRGGSHFKTNQNKTRSNS